MTESNIKKTYLPEFLQNGLIDEAISLIDARCKIYNPLVDLSGENKQEDEEEKCKNYKNPIHSHNLFQFYKIGHSRNCIDIEKEWLKIQILILIKYANDIDTFQFAILDDDVDERISIKEFEDKYEGSKYGQLILLFSNAKKCNIFNINLDDIENIKEFSAKETKKLQESSQFLQYSHFDNGEVREKEGIESQSNMEGKLDNIEDNYDLNREHTDDSTINTYRENLTTTEDEKITTSQTLSEQSVNSSIYNNEQRNPAKDNLNIKDLTNSIERSIPIQQTQIELNYSSYDKEGEILNQHLDASSNSAGHTDDVIPSLSYRYTPQQIEEFFAYDNGQVEEHTLEESICRPLIGKQIHKPFFKYCKIYPKVENIHLKSIGHHIIIKDPQRHKAKLLEMIQGEQLDKYEDKNNQDIIITT